MIYAITQFVSFDVDREKKRLNSCFEGEQKNRQLEILQLFLDKKYSECYTKMVELPYDKQKECSEVEYVNTFVYESVKNVCENANIKIETI
jgi:hypothetical protein